MAAVRLLRFFFFFLFLFFCLSSVSLSIPDDKALLNLKKSLNHNDALKSWVSGSSPCSLQAPWLGVVCFNGIITGLRLGQLGLSGKIDIDALHELRGLRSLSFVNNSFTGQIPEFNRLGALKAIYLSRNQFSGEIPSDFFSSMGSLKKLWLSGNNFTGKLPNSLAKLTHLIELHLDNNQFSGEIPPISQPTLTSLNLSNNKLEGEIPSSLSKFNTTSFAGNPKLCGKQMGNVCDSSVEQTSESTPVSMGSETNNEQDNKKSSKVMVMVLILTVFIVLLFLASVVTARRREEDFNMLGRENYHVDHHQMVNVQVAASNRKNTESARKSSDSGRRGSHNGSKSAASVGDLVVVNDEKGVFGLPDLMKAAAEVLGNGGLGSAYKAVMSNGVAMVVKRMREMNRLARDGFDGEMRRIGRLRHRNVLTPLAYHYRKEEKLLVSEYVPKGSLLYVLHGDRGICHAELNWATRLKIIQGIARGMGFLHSEFASADLPHGNLKSSNVLLGPNYDPLLSDYAFHPLINTTHAHEALFAYKSPEATSQPPSISPKCDVYCMGIIILEILTGKFPSQYLNNQKGGTDVVQWVRSAISEQREAELIDPEIAGSTDSVQEMERLLHIGAACTESNPEQRLDMKEAVRRVEELRVSP